MATAPAARAGRKLKNAVAKCRDKLFVFVTRRKPALAKAGAPPTNNACERALRPSVIFRKVTNGFRSVWGSAFYADACSIVATAALNGRTALDAIRTCLTGGSVIVAA